ncbi:MAG: flavodoxin family protein [Eubacterium sp.]|nr:flavodoxin family protein [Eubacterium sp.]
MSKILVLTGSVRKNGNTDMLVEAFVKGAEKNNEVEVISVENTEINPCIGCNTCFTRDGNECFQKDDMSIVYEKMKWADVLIIASPVYFYGVSAQLKAIIDRMHTPMRDTFRVKKLGLLLVGAATLPELFDPILNQYRLVLNFFHLEDTGKVLVRGAKDKGDVQKTEGLKEAFALGASIK